MASHGLHIPSKASWYATLRAELLSFPAGRNDDIVDMFGLFGQLLETVDERTAISAEAAEAAQGPLGQAF